MNVFRVFTRQSLLFFIALSIILCCTGSKKEDLIKVLILSGKTTMTGKRQHHNLLRFIRTQDYSPQKSLKCLIL